MAKKILPPSSDRCLECGEKIDFSNCYLYLGGNGKNRKLFPTVCLCGQCGRIHGELGDAIFTRDGLPAYQIQGKLAAKTESGEFVFQ